MGLSVMQKRRFLSFHAVCQWQRQRFALHRRVQTIQRAKGTVPVAAGQSGGAGEGGAAAGVSPAFAHVHIFCEEWGESFT